MKLIKQSFEFINQTDFSLVGIKKHIERCARVSYKSENKITDTSYEKFVNMLESRGHNRPLEFGTVYLTLRGDDTDALRNIFIYTENPWTKIRKQVIKAEYDPNIHVVLNHVTTNYRVIVENHLEEDLKYLCEPTEHHIKRYTLLCTTALHCYKDLTRHRKFSFAIESTRYCNYNNTKKFGEMTFIKPTWYDNSSKMQKFIFKGFLKLVEKCYKFFIVSGWQAQQAAEVLPQCIKGDMIITGFEGDWKHLLDLRYKGTTGAPHPMVKELATLIKNELEKQGFKYEC